MQDTIDAENNSVPLKVRIDLAQANLANLLCEIPQSDDKAHMLARGSYVMHTTLDNQKATRRTDHHTVRQTYTSARPLQRLQAYAPLPSTMQGYQRRLSTMPQGHSSCAKKRKAHTTSTLLDQQKCPHVSVHDVIARKNRLTSTDRVAEVNDLTTILADPIITGLACPRDAGSRSNNGSYEFNNKGPGSGPKG